MSEPASISLKDFCIVADKLRNLKVPAHVPLEQWVNAKPGILAVHFSMPVADEPTIVEK